MGASCRSWVAVALHGSLRNATAMSEDATLAACLERLSAGDPAAREDLVGLAIDRMQAIAHRMLRTFPNVQRWEQTDDVVQNAAMRLYRALLQVTPNGPQGLMALAATQIRREMLDLARKHSGPESYSANHETNVRRVSGIERVSINGASHHDESLDHLSRWTRFHEAAEALPLEEREIFGLVWYLGMKQEEVCRLRGCSIRTIKRRWEYIKHFLAEKMNGESPQ
jgi:RNA polymerase sigma factor (sigma-70 family)